MPIKLNHIIEVRMFFSKELNKLKKTRKDLKIEFNNTMTFKDTIRITRHIILDNTDYYVQIRIKKNKKVPFPIAYLLNHKHLHHIDFHIYEDGEICLNHYLIILEWWDTENYSIEKFIDIAVEGYISVLHYYCNYGKWIHGEWEHGSAGMQELIDSYGGINKCLDSTQITIKNYIQKVGKYQSNDTRE